jgi:hypothetical protein
MHHLGSEVYLVSSANRKKKTLSLKGIFQGALFVTNVALWFQQESFSLCPVRC